jgi:hypothetical protein
VHAAAAERIHESLPGGGGFGVAAFDASLRAAAKSLGIDVFT